jgi:alkylhydroperoxidase/carboxymuconolactone decarboxylase family protein YurZ
MKTIIAPRVHLNGDTKATLQSDLADAAKAIRQAQEALRKTLPNARSYYVIGPDAFSRARNEYMERSEKLQDIYDELAAIFNAISEGQVMVEVEVNHHVD